MSSFVNLLTQQPNSSLLLPLFLIIIALFSISFLFKRFPPNNKTLPPSPPRLPIIGNFHQLGLHPHRSLRSLAQIHGPIMLLHLGSVPVLVISSADTACEIMKTHDIVFANRPKSVIYEKLLYDYRDVALAPYGEYWRQMKSVLVLHLLSNKRVHSFRSVRQEETAYMIEKIQWSCSSSSSSSVNLSEIFATVTNDVVCRSALGRKYSSDTEGGTMFKEVLREFVELLGCFNVGDYIPWLAWVSRLTGLDSKLEKVAKRFDEFLDGIVEEHIQRHNKGRNGDMIKDFVDVLLQIQKDETLGFLIDRISIKALLLDAFAAGTDTTSTVLEWAMTELLRHPEQMKKLQNEVRKLSNNKKSELIREDDLDKLHYLKAVIKETLRIHPPIPLLIFRESTQDVRVKGHDIAARTRVIINAWTIGRDPEVWDRAEEFWPERFLNSSVDFKGHDFQLIPFGAGRRICPGIHFAMCVNELVLANLFQKFDWTLPDGANGEDMNMNIVESTGFTIHRKSPLIAVATPYC